VAIGLTVCISSNILLFIQVFLIYLENINISCCADTLIAEGGSNFSVGQRQVRINCS
jgi:ABC-type multidrug transport system fused ATPase/permease subunit